MANKVEETSSPSFLVDLPRVEFLPNSPLFQYKGFWSFPHYIESLPFVESQYNPLPTDVLIASFPKSGTTWLKALTFAILHNDNPDDPLQTHNPHQLVPSLEDETFGENPTTKIDDIASPRIFSTHIPYSILPKNVKKISSGCKIIYISRNPSDVIVSGWNFFRNGFGSQKSMQEYFDEFMHGTTLQGPFFDHVLEYWNEREKENMLFITYEGLHENPNKNVKRIADFLRCSLSDEEIEQIVKKTSFAHLSKLDINSSKDKGCHLQNCELLPYSSFFRNGKVGDGKKSLTPEMLQRIDAITYKKWGGSALESEP